MYSSTQFVPDGDEKNDRLTAKKNARGAVENETQDVTHSHCYMVRGLVQSVTNKTKVPRVWSCPMPFVHQISQKFPSHRAWKRRQARYHTHCDIAARSTQKAARTEKVKQWYRGISLLNRSAPSAQPCSPSGSRYPYSPSSLVLHDSPYLFRSI